MTVGDIWYNKINCTTNNRGWSFGLYMRETTAIIPVDDGRVASDAVSAHIGSALKSILTTTSCFESVQSWRRWPSPARPGYTFTTSPTGTVSGDALPNDNAIHVTLEQTFTDAKFNGGIYIAGQSDYFQNANKWVAAYMSAGVKTFTDTLPEFINAVSGDTGQFNFVVLSKKYSPATTTIGTPIDVTTAVASDRVMSQRRRQQKKHGLSPDGS